jgi:hypothetical protein
MLLDGRVWFGVILGVAGTYIWHKYQTAGS